MITFIVIVFLVMISYPLLKSAWLRRECEVFYIPIVGFIKGYSFWSYLVTELFIVILILT